jgi:hypothetical protein
MTTLSASVLSTEVLESSLLTLEQISTRFTVLAVVLLGRRWQSVLTDLLSAEQKVWVSSDDRPLWCP